MKNTVMGMLGGSALMLGGMSQGLAETYEIDPAHTFIEFKTQHLGYSWLHGRFNDISGTFEYNAESPGDSKVNIKVVTASVDSNHQKRDEHLRSEDFLSVENFPEATFVSTGYEGDANGGTITGDLTLHGTTIPVSIEVTKIGEGDDPWGGYRAGFVGTLALTRKDFGIEYDLGPNAEVVQLDLNIEGIRK